MVQNVLNLKGLDLKTVHCPWVCLSRVEPLSFTHHPTIHTKESRKVLFGEPWERITQDPQDSTSKGHLQFSQNILDDSIIFSSAYPLPIVCYVCYHPSYESYSIVRLHCFADRVGSQGSRVARHVLRAPPKTTRITSAATASTKAGAPKAPAPAAPKHQRHPKIEKARDKAIQNKVQQPPRNSENGRENMRKRHIANTLRTHRRTISC